jgi:hypothetical protein
MAPVSTYVVIDPQAQRVLQLIIAAAPLLLVFFMRIILGRSKEMVLAVWVSLGWFALRASMNPSMSFIGQYARSLERLIQG